jgi:hypothetical protein
MIPCYVHMREIYVKCKYLYIGIAGSFPCFVRSINLSETSAM